LLRHL